jgi:hypothetical protein
VSCYALLQTQDVRIGSWYQPELLSFGLDLQQMYVDQSELLRSFVDNQVVDNHIVDFHIVYIHNIFSTCQIVAKPFPSKLCRY